MRVFHGVVYFAQHFILAINDIVYTLPKGVQCSLYVDDFAIWLCYFNEKEGQKVVQAAIDNIISRTSSYGLPFQDQKL